MSMTPYCSGGLLRHYDHAFKMHNGDDGVQDTEMDADAQRRWEEVMTRFSTLNFHLRDYNTWINVL
jgi:hypothetical protein